MSRIYSLNLTSARTMVALLLVVAVLSVGSMTVYAATSTDSTQLSQVIGNGSYLVEFQTSAHGTVGSPLVTFGAETFSFDCLEGGTAATGTLGTATERLYVYNPGAANAGWNLNIAATATTDTWTSGGDNYDFNEESGTPLGCVDDGATTDADAFGGMLSVDASAGAPTIADCATCVITNVTMQATDNFKETTNDSINIVAAAAGSDDFGRWYFTGIALSQVIPAEQATGTYTITMDITGTTL